MEQFFQSLPIAQISISKTNRKRFNEQALNELADNIKANGLIQPILVRPMSPSEQLEPYEIVCGERRYRASIIAGLHHINTICRELTDTQAAELQLIENLQREDPHPMEEAEGYQALMLHSGYTADMLADKLNKSRSQIYATLKLCNLCKELRDEFFNNEKFTRSLALLIARIPVPALQVEAFNEIIDEYGLGEPMSYRDAAEHIQANYNVNLKIAFFSTTDTKLVPEAGSCKTCPKRTGNDPDLADLDKNICTDPKCYESKAIAHNAQIIEKAERNGITVINGEEARKAISHAHDKAVNYATDATHLFRFRRVKNNADRNKTVIAAIGSDKLPEPIAIAVSNGVPTRLFNPLHIQITLEELGFCDTEVHAQTKAIEQADKGTSNTDSDDDGEEDNDGDEDDGTDQESLDRAAEADKVNRDADNEEIKRMRIYRTIRNRAPLSIDSLRLFVRDLENSYSHNIPAQYHEELYGQSMATDEDRFAYIDVATSEQLQLLIIDYVVGYSILKPRWRGWDTQQFINRADEAFVLLRDIAECEGIDIATAEQELAAPVQAPATEQTEPEAAPAPKKRGRPSKADKAAHEATSAPTPTDKWPFPTPKTGSEP